MNMIDLESAAGEIKQACDDAQGGPLPYFFLVGAGISRPPISVASEIEEECRKIAQKYRRTDEPPPRKGMDTYSYWFQKAFPHPRRRQKYLRDLIRGRNISQANFRLAHLLLEKRIANLVVTTNFDDFLSRALVLFGNQPIVCDHPQMVERIDPEEQHDIKIVHVHGTYWFYDCINLGNEIKDRAMPSARTTTTMLALLDNILWSRMPLVIGYSGWEGDVVMTALERRARERRLPNRMYWFCYRQASIEPLPDWLKNHDDVCFVIPQRETLPPPQAAEPRGDEDGAVPGSARATARSDAKRIVDTAGEEPVLTAKQVLDKLIQSFQFKAPELTIDPLQFFADHLRRSLPSDDAGRPENDIYLLSSVVERIERAKQKELHETQRTQAVESRLEKVRDALRTAQYLEAVRRGGAIGIENMSPAQRRELMSAMLSAASLITDNHVERLKGYDLVLALERFLAGDEYDPAVCEAASRALVKKGSMLAALNRKDEALTAYDEVVRRFGDSAHPGLTTEQVAKALLYKGMTLAALNRHAEAVENYDEVVSRYGDAGVGGVLEQVAKALVNKGVSLGRLDREAEEIAAYDEVIRRFDDSAGLSLTLCEQVAKALINKGVTLGDLGRSEEEIAAYDEVIRRFGDSAELTLRERVAKVLANKGAALVALNRQDEAAVVYQEAVRLFGEATEPSLREQGARALNGIGFITLCEAKRVWAGGDQESARSILNRAKGMIASA
ncbi:MAG: tetratricopeptide repeat protein, partial [Pyrinomonadaceae bacterium]